MEGNLTLGVRYLDRHCVLKSWFSPKLYTGRSGTPCWMANLGKSGVTQGEAKMWMHQMRLPDESQICREEKSLLAIERFHPSRLKCSQDISKNESDFAQSGLTLRCTFLSSVSTCSWRPPGWTWHDVAMRWRRGAVAELETLSCRRPPSLPLAANC